MKKFAMLVSLMTLVFAFTVTTVSAQKVTSNEKATTEKVSSDKGTPAAKACCSDKKAGCSDKKTSSAKACCSDKSSSAKSGCSKTCTPAEKAACTKEGHANTEAAPVPKKN